MNTPHFTAFLKESLAKNFKLRSCTIRRSAGSCEPKSLLARQKSAGILDVFQAFLTMPTAILAARTRAEAIGTASKVVFILPALPARIRCLHQKRGVTAFFAIRRWGPHESPQGFYGVWKRVRASPLASPAFQLAEKSQLLELPSGL